MKNNLDKSISLIVIIISGLAIILWFYNYYLGLDNSILLKDFNVNSFLLWGINNTDLLIIFYIFLCLQLAGLSEFKQRQDYIVVAFISLIFTPVDQPYRREIANERGNMLPVLKWKPPTENSIDFLMVSGGFHLVSKEHKGHPSPGTMFLSYDATVVV